MNHLVLERESRVTKYQSINFLTFNTWIRNQSSSRNR